MRCRRGGGHPQLPPDIEDGKHPHNEDGRDDGIDADDAFHWEMISAAAGQVGKSAVPLRAMRLPALVKNLRKSICSVLLVGDPFPKKSGLSKLERCDKL